jgi:hypothetical protein
MIVSRIERILNELENVEKEIKVMRERSHDFFLFENIRGKLESYGKELTN